MGGSGARRTQTARVKDRLLRLDSDRGELRFDR